MQKILLVMAMEQEAKPLIESMKLIEDQSLTDIDLPFRTFHGVFADKEIVLSINGKNRQYNVENVGTAPALLNTYICIQKFSPDFIISAGTCGAFHSKGAQIGDVYLSKKYFVFHDRRIELPGYADYGIGKIAGYDTEKLAQAMQLKQGQITTGNSLNLTATDLEMITKVDGEIKEMEAAAIAWVCQLKNIPFFAMKSVTDLIDIEHPSGDQFFKNLQLACTHLQNAILKIFTLSF